MASYFGCRPVSMFDTRSRFAGKDQLAIRPTIWRPLIGRKMLMRIQRHKVPRTAWTGMTTEWYLSTRTGSLLPMSIEARIGKAIATAALTMASMRAWMRPDLYFGDISLWSLLLTVSSKSLTSSSPRWQSLIWNEKTIALRSRFHLHPCVSLIQSLIYYRTGRQSSSSERITLSSVFSIIFFPWPFMTKSSLRSPWRMSAIFFEPRSLLEKNVFSWKWNAQFWIPRSSASLDVP